MLLLSTAAGAAALTLRTPPPTRCRSPRMLEVVAPETAFPVLLDAVDAVPRTSKAVLGPISRTVRDGEDAAPVAASILEQLAASPAPLDLLLAALLATGLYLGPDFLLAPLGLASPARLGYRTEALVGRVLPGQGGEWLEDRAGGYASEAPLPVRVATGALFAAAGFALERVLTAASSEQAAFYLGASTTLWGSLYEVARPKLASRAEREQREVREADFIAFAEARLEAGGSCHETEIVKAFRRYYPKYRVNRGITDKEVYDLMRRWMSVPRTQLLPGGAISTEIVSARSPAGYYSGLSVAKEPDVGLG